MKVKTNIWKIRYEKGWSMHELARVTGISKTTLYNYENNNVSPTLENLYKIATTLNVNMEELYYVSNEEYSPPIY